MPTKTQLDTSGMAAPGGKPQARGALLAYVASVSQTSISSLLARLLVLRRILLLNDGRDKTMKIVQYTIKLLLWRQLVIGKRHGPARAALTANCSLIASQFSTTRGVIRFCNSLNSLDEFVDSLKDLPPMGSSMSPLELLRSPYLHAYLATINTVLGFVNCIADDAVVFAKIGILKDKETKRKWETLSDRLWFVTIFLDMRELRRNIVKQHAKIEKCRRAISKLLDVNSIASAASKEFSYSKYEDEKSNSSVSTEAETRNYPSQLAELSKELTTLNEKMHYYNISFIKLIFDLIFCCVDVFSLEDRGFVGPGTQILSGLSSALIGFRKLYIKNK